MILDIGCGERPRGDTNLDSQVFDVPNFVKGDVLALPFDDNEFDTVFSSGLSLWQKVHPFEDLIKAFKEAIRVAKVQVVMEYAFFENYPSWNCHHPVTAYRELKKTFPEIKLSLSQRQKRFGTINLFTKIFGVRMAVFVLNKVLKTSFLAKLKIKLLPLNYPEVKE